MFKRFIEYLYIKYVFMPELMGMHGTERLDYLLAHGVELVTDDETLDNVLNDLSPFSLPVGKLGLVFMARDEQIQATNMAMHQRRHNPLH